MTMGTKGVLGNDPFRRGAAARDGASPTEPAAPIREPKVKKAPRPESAPPKRTQSFPGATAGATNAPVREALKAMRSGAQPAGASPPHPPPLPSREQVLGDGPTAPVPRPPERKSVVRAALADLAPVPTQPMSPQRSAKAPAAARPLPPGKKARPLKASRARAAKGGKAGAPAQVTAPIPVAHPDSPVGLRPPLSAPGPHVNSPEGLGLDGPVPHANSPLGLRAPASAPGPHVNSPIGLGLEGPVPHPNSPIGIPQGSAPRPHPNSPIGIPQGSAPRPHPNSPIGIPQGSAPRPHPNSPIGIPQGSAPRPHPNSPIGIPQGSAPRPHPNSPDAVPPPSAPRAHLNSPEGLGLEGVVPHPNSPEGLAREARPSAERVRERLNLATAAVPGRATPAPPAHEPMRPPRASPAPLVPGHEPRLSASSGGWRGALEGLAHAAKVGLGLGGGDQVDVWGKDPALEARLRPLGDFLLERYWRLELEGAHHLPSGPCLVIANHSGALPLDGAVLASALRRARPELQAPRWLVEDQVFDAPVVGLVLARLGAIRANPDNAIRLLREGRPVLVFPEGIHGLSKPFQQRYQLQRFGRGGFVKLAVRERVPIIPAAIVGAEESMPLLGRLPGGWLGLPHLPVTPPPLPARWKIALGPAIDLSDAPAQAPEGDLAWVQRANDRTRSTIEGLIQELLRARPGVF